MPIFGHAYTPAMRARDAELSRIITYKLRKDPPMQTETLTPWKALEAFCTKYPTVRPECFMFMGTAIVGGVQVYLYKHWETRRYLNLSAELQSYEFTPLGSCEQGGRYIYDRMTHRQRIAHVTGGF